MPKFLVGNIYSDLLVGGLGLGRIAFFSYLSEKIYHIYHSHISFSFNVNYP